MQQNLFGFDSSDGGVNRATLDKIKGLQYFPNFLSEIEEVEILRAVESESWLDDLKRKVQHYGFKYDYKSRSIDESYRIGSLPSWSQFVIERMLSQKIIDYQPDQLIINKYQPGEGIAMHVDCEPCFTDTIISLSLGSDIIMNFKKLESEDTKKSVFLQRRSLVVLSGESRYQYHHGIAPRKTDKFNGQIKKRSTRVSLTFRKVILNS